MQVYLDLLSRVQKEGVDRPDRTGVGTRSIFGAQMRLNLREGFPLLTTKKCHVRSIFAELLWFLQGSTNVKSLQAQGVSIWNEWADIEGNLGPVYGKQWRAWEGKQGPIDQVMRVIETIKSNPESRRLIVSAWNVAQLDEMALPPCHLLFQFYVSNGALSCQIYQRSCDIFLGLPFNLASYALLTHLVAEQTNLNVGDLVWTGGDVHLYHNHFQQAQTQCSRVPRALPTLKIIRTAPSIDSYQITDFEVQNYQPYPGLRAPIAI